MAEFINQMTETPQARGYIGIAGSATLTVTRERTAKGLIGIQGMASLTVTQQYAAAADIGITGTATMRIDDTPDVNLTAQADIAIQGTASMSLRKRLRAKANIGITGTAVMSQVIPERFYWNVLINTLPASATGPFREYSGKLTVDGEVLPIESFEYSEPRGQLTQQLNISLGDVTDRDKITRTSAVKFEIGEKISGVWVWDTLIDTTESANSAYQITRDRDTATFSCTSDMNARLRKAPTRDLIIYDSTQATLATTDFDPIPDIYSNNYYPELKAISAMTLYDILHEIFVVRCGFSGIETNIADYRISRVQLEAGQRYIEAVGGLIGMFRPSFEVSGNTLIIRDTTQGYDTGDPDPLELTIDDSYAVTIGITKDFTRIDVIKIFYTISKREWDYSVPRQESVTTPYGSFGDANYQEVTVTRNWVDYYRQSNPFVAVDSDLVSITTSTVKNSQTIFESTETFAYDGFGNPQSREKNYSKRLPDLENDGTLSLLTVKTENENWTYQTHPYIPKAQYVAKHEIYERGMQVTDAANQQLGEDWKRDYETAYRGGNLADGLAVTLSPLRTYVEQFRPLRGGKAEVTVYEVDEASESPVVLNNETQTVPGELAQNAATKTQLPMYVTIDGEEVEDGVYFETLNCGELPVTRAIQLAQRIITQSRREPRSITQEIAGYRRDIKKGTPFEPKGRSDEDLGKYRVVSYRIRGNRQQVTMTIDGDEI